MFSPAPSQTFYLDLDAPPGAFSRWRHDSLGPLDALRARLRVPRIRKDGKWKPTFVLYVQGNDDSKLADELGLQIYAMDDKFPMRMRLAGRLHGKPIEEIPLQTMLRIDEELKVEMTWASPHAITFLIGTTETRTIKVSWSVCKALITASTGELKVDSLELGTVKP
jgi:hypothetical protein